MSATAPSRPPGDPEEEQRLLDEGQWDDDGRGGYKRCYLSSLPEGEIVHQTITLHPNGEWWLKETGPRTMWSTDPDALLAEVLNVAEEQRAGAPLVPPPS